MPEEVIRQRCSPAGNEGCSTSEEAGRISHHRSQREVHHHNTDEGIGHSEKKLRDEILAILKGTNGDILKDIANAVLSTSTVECLQRGIEPFSKKVTRHTCPDERCRVAFWLEIYLGLSYRLVVEFSKLGKYARVYWKGETVLATEYLSAPPPENQQAFRANLETIEKVFSECEVILLSSDELNEDVPFEVDEYNPDDNATVGSLLFAPEYH